MVFFYLVTTSWFFYISLCENSINQSIYRDRSVYNIALFKLQHLNIIKMLRARRSTASLKTLYWYVSSAFINMISFNMPFGTNPMCYAAHSYKGGNFDGRHAIYSKWVSQTITEKLISKPSPWPKGRKTLFGREMYNVRSNKILGKLTPPKMQKEHRTLLTIFECV